MAVSIYERLGGHDPLYAMVERVYDMMNTDREMKKFFKAEFDLDKLTQRTADFLEARWGGAAFQGAICGTQLTDKNEVSLLWQAHSRVGVTNADYTSMVKMYEKTMKKMGVSKALMQEMLQDIESLRDPIVDEKRKHREKWMKSNEISAAEEAAWKKEAEARRQKEEERKERLANFRKEKKKQERLKQKEAEKKAAEKKAAEKKAEKIQKPEEGGAPEGVLGIQDVVSRVEATAETRCPSFQEELALPADPRETDWSGSVAACEDFGRCRRMIISL